MVRRVRIIWRWLKHHINTAWSAVTNAADNLVQGIQSTRHKLSRTLFTKYLFVTSAIVIISFIFFGVILAGIVTDRWQDEQQQLLAENINTISERTGRYMVAELDPETQHVTYRFSEASYTSMRAAIAVLGLSLDADIFIVDMQNNILMCDEEDSQNASSVYGDTACKHRGNLPEKLVEAVYAEAGKSETGDYRATGTLGGIYDDRQFIVGTPVITKDVDGNDVVVAVAFAVSTAEQIEAFRTDVFSIVIIAIVIAALVSILAVYFITYQQVKPLRDMVSAVSRFAGGDFCVRVPVTDETEVGQLAAAFNDMARSLASSETMRRSFVANVSHELKTPMTTISGFVDGILDGTIPQDKHAQYLTVVSAETKRLARLVRSMLDLSKIDSGDMKLNRKKFNISKIVFDTLLSFEHRIDEKNIEIQGMDRIRPLTVNGDPDLIHQVVYNLIENAVKFVNPGGYINIKVYSRERQAYVKISNSGIGIPSEELPHIFERFYKTDKSRSIDKSGVGLGLFIVKTIIGLHNGGIDVRSAEGSYCEFEFHIPISNRQ